MNIEDKLKQHLVERALEWQRAAESAKETGKYLDKVTAHARAQECADVLTFVRGVYDQARGKLPYGENTGWMP